MWPKTIKKSRYVWCLLLASKCFALKIISKNIKNHKNGRTKFTCDIKSTTCMSDSVFSLNPIAACDGTEQKSDREEYLEETYCGVCPTACTRRRLRSLPSPFCNVVQWLSKDEYSAIRYCVHRNKWYGACGSNRDKMRREGGTHSGLLCSSARSCREPATIIIAMVASRMRWNSTRDVMSSFPLLVWPSGDWHSLARLFPCLPGSAHFLLFPWAFQLSFLRSEAEWLFTGLAYRSMNLDNKRGGNQASSFWWERAGQHLAGIGRLAARQFERALLI